MHILYADESEVFVWGKPPPRYFILAGVSVFERQAHWLSRKMDDIAARFDADAPHNIELHGSPMFNRHNIWKNYSSETRVSAIKDVLRVLAESPRDNRIFAAVVEKDAVEEPPLMHAFEQLSTRFNDYLGRIGRDNNRQTGIILFDKSAHEKTIQSATSVYRRLGQLEHFAEVPAFMDSKSSRLIQLADIVAYAINRKFSRDDGQFHDIIQSRFDSFDGKMHGYYVKNK